MGLCEYAGHLKKVLKDTAKNKCCYCTIQSIEGTLYTIKPISFCEAYVGCKVFREKKLEESEKS